jgi:ferric-dicitrate binding protein FerR (iron transport regulator)
MLLHPGEKAVVLKQFGEIVKKENDDPNFMAWKTKRLEFIDTPLSEIIDVLRKVYHKDISVLNPEILDCRITATFEQQSLETVLKVLQSTIDIEVKANASGIEISGNGCQ